jgi:phosphatidate cytidylyltransferase
MKQRITTALWGLPLLLICVWFETPWFPLLILLIAIGVILGILEFYRLVSLLDGQPLTLFGLVWSLGFVANAHFENDFIIPLLVSAIILPLLWILFRPAKEEAFTRWAWTLGGILYIGWMLSHYVALREVDQGREWVLLAFLSTFACDTAALFIGRAWGKRLMAPSISPEKTWEGALAGLIAAIAATLILNSILSQFNLGLPLNYGQMILLGGLIGVSAQLGDLWESLLKRRAGVKDSGSLIPGHGGVLDRFDSIIFTGIIVYYYMSWIAG